MATFDLHLHPVFKQAITRFERTYPSTRTSAQLMKPLELAHKLPAWLDEQFFHFLQGQSSIDQLRAAEPIFGSASIVPLERFATHKTGLFGKLLNGSFTDPFDKAYMDAIRDGELSYYQLFVKELDLLRVLVADNNVKMRWITRQDRSALDATDGVNMTLSMEGGHGLCRSLIGKAGWDDKPVAPATPTSDTVWKDFDGKSLQPAESLRRLQQALWNDGLDLMYLTLTHLSHIDQQLLATHAYGMKMLNTWEVRPQGNGLTEMGRDVVKAAYELRVDVKKGNTVVAKNASVLIDIKHMGLKSRLDLYAYRRQLKKEWEAKGDKRELPPLLASHMGVTGYSLEEWKSNLKRGSARVEGSPRSVGFKVERQQVGEWGALNKSFTYNAWTINLMDEEIVEVLASGGLIGISLDVRILGWHSALAKDEEEEYMSPDDFRFFFPQEHQRILGGRAGTEAMAEESWLKPTKKDRQPLAFCFNLLHVIHVGMVAGRKDVWDRVCVGSDFDGLIDPVVTVENAAVFKNIEGLLTTWLDDAEKAYRKQHGGPALIPRDTNNNPIQHELELRIAKVIHENGRRFLKDEWK